MLIEFALASGIASAVSRADLSFYEDCQPTDYTVRGDEACRGALWEKAKADLDSALAAARKQLDDRVKIQLSEDMSRWDRSIRISHLKAIKELKPNFEKEQKSWEKFENDACGYLRNRDLFGANGPAVLAPACETNILRDRTRHLRALTEAFEPIG